MIKDTHDVDEEKSVTLSAFAFLVFPTIIALGISLDIAMVQFGALLLYLPLFAWAITSAFGPSRDSCRGNGDVAIPEPGTETWFLRMTSNAGKKRQNVAVLMVLSLITLLWVFMVRTMPASVPAWIGVVSLIILIIHYVFVLLWPDNPLYRKLSGTIRMRQPEKDYLLDISEDELVCRYRKDGRLERVRWDDLRMIEIVTTDQGPSMPDFFYVLHGSEGGCAVPLGAAGWETILERMHALPGFDNSAAITAASETDNARFIVWERK